jgi:hypothetical protein
MQRERALLDSQETYVNEKPTFRALTLARFGTVLVAQVVSGMRAEVFLQRHTRESVFGGLSRYP